MPHLIKGSVYIALLFLGACGAEASKGNLLTCGPGTHEENTQCVPDENMELTCGPGTHEENAQCVPDENTELTCGPGTHEENTQCVPDENTELTCGPGTHEENAQCVPDENTELTCGPGTHEENAQCVPDKSDELIALITAWDEANLYINNGLGYTGESNQQAILSQNEDAILEAILSMYRATSDISYLHLFVQHADLVLAWRDDNAGFTDYKGQSNPVWSNAYDQYVKDGNAYPFLLESGQLTWPLADFAQMVLNDEELKPQDAGNGQTLSEVALGYVTAAEESLAFHHQRWHTDTLSIDGESIEIGWFSAQADADFLCGIPPGGVLPVNHQTSMGRTVAALYAATGNPSHADRAQRMARWVELELTLDSGGAYVWNYWPLMSYAEGLVVGNDNIEDFGHAILTIQFAHAVVHAGLGIWDETDLDRFERTFRQNLYEGSPGVFNMFVDGTILADALKLMSYQFQSARFLRLAPYGANPAEHYEIARYTLLDELAIHEPGQIGGATGLASLAELIRFWDLQ